jgi:hypothetical protein
MQEREKTQKNITKKNMISNVSKQMIKRNTNNKVLPLVTFPLVAYYIGDSKDKALSVPILYMIILLTKIPSPRLQSQIQELWNS